MGLPLLQRGRSKEFANMWLQIRLEVLVLQTFCRVSGHAGILPVDILMQVAEPTSVQLINPPLFVHEQGQLARKEMSAREMWSATNAL
jgi:hypothetical protein